MIQLIVGDKGSGKTKTIIEMMNTAIEQTDGHIVCIEKGMKSTYNIKSSVRIIDADDYNVKGYDQLYGFIMGTLAGDYDIQEVYLDGVLKIGGGDVDGLAQLLDHVVDVAPENIKFVVTVSTDMENLTDAIRKFL
ncbi:MAG: hypothetical protein IKV55_02225 [Oscillospiraceae bacterium]|nr:hypothetical protein [Oscillospiraceae bacterium]